VHDEDVRFHSNGCSIAGSFAEAANPVAAALVITGSGKINRDSDAMLPLGLSLRTSVTKAAADTLAAAGVSVLRYDKRGVGGSGGDYYRAGMSDQLTDARAGLGWLAGRAPGLPLLVVGHSEGTFYAAQLAADPGVAGIVLLSGPAQRGDRVLAWQTEMIAARLPRAARLMFKLTRTDIVRLQRKRIARIQATSADVIRIQGVRGLTRAGSATSWLTIRRRLYPWSPGRSWRSPAASTSRSSRRISSSSAAWSRARTRGMSSAT